MTPSITCPVADDPGDAPARAVLEHAAHRIGRAIVSFPNFGHWRIRYEVGLRGRMPVTDNLPHSWYDTQHPFLHDPRFRRPAEPSTPRWSAPWRSMRAASRCGSTCPGGYGTCSGQAVFLLRRGRRWRKSMTDEAPSLRPARAGAARPDPGERAFRRVGGRHKARQSRREPRRPRPPDLPALGKPFQALASRQGADAFS